MVFDGNAGSGGERQPAVSPRGLAEDIADDVVRRVRCLALNPLVQAFDVLAAKTLRTRVGLHHVDRMQGRSRALVRRGVDPVQPVGSG